MLSTNGTLVWRWRESARSSDALHFCDIFESIKSANMRVIIIKQRRSQERYLTEVDHLNRRLWRDFYRRAMIRILIMGRCLSFLEGWLAGWITGPVCSQQEWGRRRQSISISLWLTTQLARNIPN